MPLSANERAADQVAHRALNLLRYDATARRAALGHLRALEVRLVEMLRSSRLSGEMTFAKEMRVRALLTQTRATIASAYANTAAATQQELAGLARVETAFAGKLLAPAVIAIARDSVELSAAQLRAIASNVMVDGAPSRYWWQAQAGDLQERFKREVRQGLLAAETNDELVRRIRGRATGRRNTYELNGRAYTFVEFKGGIMDTSTRHARALIRTSVQAVAADARRETFRENEDVVKGVVQVSTLDGRTTDICLAYGGKAWLYPDMEPIDHDLPYAGGTPRHWGCRSTEAPLLRSWQELGIDLQDAPQGERWSRLDGKVPADLSMEEFLERRSVAEQDEMLGVGRAQMWRDGLISLDDLVDGSGRALTLAELEELHGRAA